VRGVWAHGVESREGRVVAEFGVEPGAGLAAAAGAIRTPA
jgi:hypothetical protein